MSPSPPYQALFDASPDLVEFPDWVPSESRGGVPDEKLIELGFWAFKSAASSVDVNSPIVSNEEPAASHGSVLEARMSLRCLDAGRCRVVELVQKLRLFLSSDPAGRDPLDEDVIVSCSWPRPELSPPCRIKRSVDSSGKLQLSVDGVGEGEVGGSVSLTEEYDQTVPLSKVTMGRPAPVREVVWTVSSTNNRPSIEGIHRSGLWITAGRECFVHVEMKVDVGAEVLGLGRWRKRQLQTVHPTSMGSFALRSIKRA